MLKNYFKIAFRNIWRSKLYSMINILGLTMGLTCSSMLFMLVIDELSYDSMHSKKDRIYRVVEIDNSAEDTRYYGITAPPVGKTLNDEFPEVKGFTRLHQFGGHINFRIGDDRFQERSYYYGEQNFFSVFDAEWIAGDPATALSNPNDLVIDEEWAMRLFGKLDVVGRELDSGMPVPYTVRGVIKKIPQNSHLQYKVLAGVPSNQEFFAPYIGNWRTYGAYTYVLLEENADPKAIFDKIPQFVESHFPPELNRDFYLQPLSDIHFNSQFIEYGTDNTKGQIAYVYIFIAIGTFMLVIACINYMNLATAKSLHRGKEIGIRKVSGAMRYQLIGQFLSESTLIALVSFVLSIGLVDVALPFFNQLTDKHFEFNLDTFGEIFAILFLLSLVVGLLSGSYPALLLSKLKPTNILKGAMTTGKGSVLLRKVLVITQFTLSIIMIIATVVASKQLAYIQNKPLGFNKDQMLVIDINNSHVRSRFETIKTEYEKSPYVQKVAVSSRVPGEWKNISQVYASKPENIDDSVRVNYIGFDKDMLDVYDIELLSGSNFSGSDSSDSLHILINEKAAKSLGLEDPVGQYLYLSDETAGQFQIIGVVKDFNFESLHNPIAPIILGYRANPFNYIDYFSLKFDADHVDEVVKYASKVHSDFDTSFPIEYHFLDQQWELFYKNDFRAANVFMIGAAITILIACLGLFGLASFIIQKRTKEISIRKVLGASGLNLFVLLSRTFILQVLVSFLIATPLAWYTMRQWLAGFAFQFGLGATEFLTAGLAAVFIATASVSYRVIKATLLNPAVTLKNE